MNTLIVLIIMALAFATLAYLYHIVPDTEDHGKGRCNSEDYDIAAKIANRKHN